MTYHSNDGGGGSLRGLRVEYSGDERESRSGGEERLDSDFNDKPIYLLEHLATFTVNKESGIVYPADGMRRLLQLEKTTGIWSQKMQLCLDCQWLLIMDYETGNIIERFPASLIQEPTAFTSTDAMELYNNILVFVVSGGSGSRSEMHIFQSQSVSAVHLVEDLKNLRNGKKIIQQRELLSSQVGGNSGGVSFSGMAKPMVTTSREHHQHRSNVDQYGMGEMGQVGGVVGGGSGAANGETDSEIGGINDETSSTSSDKYERDVTVLNHCFDDIEKFIARLQHAAAASRELERRRRNRKSKKKDPGEGLLTLRTRPPHEKEFIDIFAKFKLSFNLLAKLKAHIHDPNAPELVHFLFTPLALIVEASSDTYYESQLPVRVVNPLLTREAINLLINCVTSKETELWRSLGDAWIVPRDQWKEDVGSYHPVFLDGWSPDYLVIDELETTTPTNISKRRLEMHHISGLNGRGLGHIAMTGGSGSLGVGSGIGSGAGNYDEYDGSAIALNEKYTMHSQQTPVERAIERGVSGLTGTGNAGEVGGGEFGTRSEISIDSIERSGANVITSAPNTGGQNEALLQSITAGLQSLNARRGGGGFGNESGAASEGRAGSNSAVGITNNDNENRILETWLDNLQATGAKIVLVTYPRTANNDKELSVVRGEYLEIIDDTRKWWKARNRRGQVAHVPHTIVTPYNYGDSEANNHFYGKQPQQTNNYKARNFGNTSTNNTVETIERQSTDSTDWIRNKHLGKKGEFRYF